MFGIILISVSTLMQVYVFWRAATVPFVQRHVPLPVLIGAGVVLWIIFYLGRVVGHSGTGAAAATLEFLGMNWMAMLFLTFLALLAVDLITAFGWLMPRLAAALRGWALVAGAVLSLIALFQGLRPPEVQSYEVQLNGLPQEMDGTVIIALSDLHLGSLLGERWLSARVAQVNAQRPDLVVLLGDIFEGHGPPRKELIKILDRISAPLGVWAVPGNHEFYGGYEAHRGPIEDAGFQMLIDRWVEVRPGLVLAGVEDFTARRRSGRNEDILARALARRPAGATVLLSHTPWQSEEAAQAGVGLMLSGHTHGGQIWPFGYLVRRVYPLLAGRYEVDGLTVIVTRGAGTWGPRMRLWHPGEILRVTLRQNNPNSGKAAEDPGRS
jgi:predicted MPP superfamily phosphohydrolase